MPSCRASSAWVTAGSFARSFAASSSVSEIGRRTTFGDVLGEVLEFAGRRVEAGVRSSSAAALVAPADDAAKSVLLWVGATDESLSGSVDGDSPRPPRVITSTTSRNATAGQAEIHRAIADGSAA